MMILKSGTSPVSARERAAQAPERVEQKWVPVLRPDTRQLKKLEQDDDSKKIHLALACRTSSGRPAGRRKAARERAISLQRQWNNASVRTANAFEIAPRACAPHAWPFRKPCGWSAPNLSSH
jgi:hypothetical protein